MAAVEAEALASASASGAGTPCGRRSPESLRASRSQSPQALASSSGSPTLKYVAGVGDAAVSGANTGAALADGGVGVRRRVTATRESEPSAGSCPLERARGDWAAGATHEDIDGDGGLPDSRPASAFKSGRRPRNVSREAPSDSECGTGCSGGRSLRQWQCSGESDSSATATANGRCVLPLPLPLRLPPPAPSGVSFVERPEPASGAPLAEAETEADEASRSRVAALSACGVESSSARERTVISLNQSGSSRSPSKSGSGSGAKPSGRAEESGGANADDKEAEEAPGEPTG